MTELKKWLENYWYHYKWHTIAAVFVLFLVGYTIVQNHQIEKYDMECAVITVNPWSEETNSALKEQLSELFACTVGINYLPYNGDLNSAADPNAFAAYSVRLFGDLSEKISALYFTDTPELLLNIDPNLHDAGSAANSKLTLPEGFEILCRDDEIAQKIF